METIECEIPEELADALEEVLCEQIRSPWSLEQTKKGQPFKLIGFFADAGEAQKAYLMLRESFPALHPEPSPGHLEDRDWQEAYKAFLKPWVFEDLHWVPLWMREDYAVPAGHVAIYLDAGLAFGTGSHETTRLMARRLVGFRDRHKDLFAHKHIIDAGCGSGILALSAARLGATNVFGFDRDPESIKVSRENQQINGIAQESVSFVECGLEEGLAGRQGDLILANIISDVLKIYAEQLVEATAPGGTLALSGILAREIDDVRMCFEASANDVWEGVAVSSCNDGEWADLLLERQPA